MKSATHFLNLTFLYGDDHAPEHRQLSKVVDKIMFAGAVPGSDKVFWPAAEEMDLVEALVAFAYMREVQDGGLQMT